MTVAATYIYIVLKLATFKSLSKLPTRWDDVVISDGLSVASSDFKGQCLPVEVSVALPVLTPIPGQGRPMGAPGGLDGHRNNITSSSNVSNQYQVEVGVTIHGKPHTSFLYARDPIYDHGQSHEFTSLRVRIRVVKIILKNK